MRKRTLLAVLLPLVSIGCAPTLQRSVVGSTVFDETTHTLWIVEKDQLSNAEDRLLVIVCNREGSPACIRMPPSDARDGGDYARWLQSLPAEVRRLATVPGGTGTARVVPQSPRSDGAE